MVLLPACNMTDVDRLADAAATGETEKVKTLLEQEGVDPNSLNRFGRTPLQCMMMGNVKIAELLLAHGANPNIKDSHNVLPIHDAAREGFLETVQLLIKYGAIANIRNSWNMRPIDLAREEGHQDVVDYLENYSTS